MSTNSKKNKRQVLGFLGVGLDDKDGHQRLTRTENFLLVGGSEATHEAMQDVSIKFNESLQRRGKRLEDASVEEVVDLFHKAADE
ncbi:MAG TPA: hypothetical protein VEL76_11070 [Gemmataceae bacterium]|nr:hypothetical protein [Gemmataceae bacterium]